MSAAGGDVGSSLDNGAGNAAQKGAQGAKDVAKAGAGVVASGGTNALAWAKFGIAVIRAFFWPLLYFVLLIVTIFGNMLFALNGVSPAAAVENCGPTTGGYTITPVKLSDGSTVKVPTIQGTTLSETQIKNAQQIIGVGKRMGIPDKGIVVALAAATQEDKLRNSPAAVDKDSIGLFQMRQKYHQGEPLNNVDFVSNWFYKTLQAVPNWQNLSVTQAAASVENPREDLRGEYAKWEGFATELLRALSPTVSTADAQTSFTAASNGMTSDACAGMFGTGATLPGMQYCVPTTPSEVMPTTGACTKPGGVTITIPTDKARNVAITYALQQLGKPYVRGGTGPNGYDCSGLTMRALEAAGLQPPRVSQDQQPWTKKVPLTSLAPGDLVFWGYPAHHVAMYLGQGIVVHAPDVGQNLKIEKASWGLSEISYGAVAYPATPVSPNTGNTP